MHPPARHSSRVGQRFQVALGAAAALAAISLSPGSAQAYVVTVGGVQYDVTTFTGTYDANTSSFNTAANGGVMPWWGSGSLASQFANAVGPNLGTTENNIGLQSYGPFFAWKAPASGTPGPGTQSLYTWSQAANQAGGPGASGSVSNSTSFVWAQATLYIAPAPGPLPLFGAAAAFGFSRQLRKRIKLAPAALGSALPLA